MMVEIWGTAPFGCVILDDMHFWIELRCVILSLFYYWFFRTTFIFGTFQLRKYSNFWSISFQKVCPLSLTFVVDWQKSTVHFWAVLHFYSIANFVASWLQMIPNDSKWIHFMVTSINDIQRFLAFFDLPAYLRPISSNVEKAAHFMMSFFSNKIWKQS